MAEEGKNNFIKILALALIVVVIAAGTSYLVLNYDTIKEKIGASGEDEKKIGPTYELGDFTVNLSETGNFKFVKASIVVEVSQNNLKEKLEKRNPQVRDIVISVLREQKIEELRDPEATVIKEQITENLNQILTQGEIVNVWFTELVIQ